MFKKIVISLLLLALMIISSTPVYAAPKETILIENLVYTIIDDLPVPDYADISGKGLFVYAEGMGTISYTGEIPALIELNGKTVTFRQGFGFKMDSVELGKIKVVTAGRMQLPGELLAIGFKGSGFGIIESSEGTNNLTMELETQTKCKSSLSFSLFMTKIDIDHTSAGIICDDFGGYSVFIAGSPTAGQTTNNLPPNCWL